ncbi:MAG TPA: pyridoxamine 5'-phosphate oxidase family protein [Acidobacteriota bacterium]|nr:pyridoxamine 5'-phosphate oxidase family protein [Acidobacteriota bacterium]
MPSEEMNKKEIEQFLTCARFGRIGISLEDGQPYIVPVGYAYADGKIFFHTCEKGSKITALRHNHSVCFEVDEALSDASMFKSVIVFGTAEIISDKANMIPYLQKLIDKYRVPESFDSYMSKPERNREKELEAVRICLITPKKVTGKKWITQE